jgi:tetratricopeptide (TPR) repeat protein
LSFFPFSHFCILPAISDQYEYSGTFNSSANDEDADFASENSGFNPQVNAYIDRGIRFHKRHEYASAINEYSRAISLEPNAADLYFDRGLSLSESGNYYEALNDFTKCISLNSSSDPCYFNRGIVEFELRDYPRALTDFNRTIQLFVSVKFFISNFKSVVQ